MAYEFEVFGLNALGKKDIFFVPEERETVGVASSDRPKVLHLKGFFDEETVGELGKLSVSKDISELKKGCGDIGVDWNETLSYGDEYFTTRAMVKYRSTGLEKAVAFPVFDMSIVLSVHGDRPVTAELNEEWTAINKKVRSLYRKDKTEGLKKFEELKKEIRKAGFECRSMGLGAHDELNKEFALNRKAFWEMKVEQYGLEKNDYPLFVLKDKDKISFVQSNNVIENAPDLETAVFHYKRSMSSLIIHGSDGECCQLDFYGNLKPVSFASCKMRLEDCFKNAWEKTLESVLEEKGVSRDEYMQSQWIKDVSLGLSHKRVKSLLKARRKTKKRTREWRCERYGKGTERA